MTKSMLTEAAENHKKFRSCGIKSLHILDKEIDNKRYPGFSEFFSSNVLQNSSYIWAFPKDKRFKLRDYKKLNDNIYNLPSVKNTRHAGIGIGARKSPIQILGKGNPSPAQYFIKSLFEENTKNAKGASLKGRFKYGKNDNEFYPGPGTYNTISKVGADAFGVIPINLKSRHGFFYDEDIKHKEATVSMQRYKPNHTLTEMSRFNAITFGIGKRPNLYLQTGYPGPGTYNIPGFCDRGYRGKLPIN